MKTLYLLIPIILIYNSCLADNLDSGLVSYWCFDHLSGNNIYPDMSGNGHNGTKYGSVLQIPGIRGQAAFFPGTFNNGIISDYIKVDNFPEILNSISISIWVYPSIFPSSGSDGNKTSNPLITKGFTDGHETYTLWVDYYKMNLMLNLNFNRTDCIQNFPYLLSNNGVWYHLVSVYDYEKHEIRCYFNGNLLNKCSYSDPLVPNGEALFFGASFPGGKEYFRGGMDEARIYNRALTDDEVKALYALGTGQNIFVTSGNKIDFGTVYGVIDSTILLNIKNNLSVPLKLLPARLKNGTSFKAASGKSYLAPGEEELIAVGYKTVSYGTMTDTLYIESPINCDNTLLAIPVTINNREENRFIAWIDDTTVIAGTTLALPVKIRLTKDTIYKNLKITGEIRLPEDAFFPIWSISDTNIKITHKQPETIIGFKTSNITASKDTSTLLYIKGTVSLPAVKINNVRITNLNNDNPTLYSEGGSGNLTVELCAFDLSHVSFTNEPFIQIYPNPANERIEINPMNIKKDIQVTIYNRLGSQLKTFIIPKAEKQEMDISDLPAGYYYISFDFEGSRLFKQLAVCK